jgi:outer membrane protein OmpA-like peptidoglycan-associated protein
MTKLRCATYTRIALAGGAVALLAATGCATKKHVQQQIQPVQQRVEAIEKKDVETAKQIGELEQGVARLDEATKAIEQQAQAAAKAAKAADDAAKESDKKAENALMSAAASRKLAEEGISKLSDVEKQILGLEDYKLVVEEAVLFGFGKDALDKEGLARLDSFAGKLGGMKRFVVEVQGYTDSIGDKTFNLALSQRRAQNVLRYLTGTHKVPLHRISVVGMGTETPVADNKSADGRKQNRRVELHVFSADAALKASK